MSEQTICNAIIRYKGGRCQNATTNHGRCYLHGGAPGSGRPKGTKAVNHAKVCIPKSSIGDSTLKIISTLDLNEVAQAITYIRNAYAYYKQGAKTRKITFNLSFEEFSSFAGQPCHYCGETGLSGVRLDRLDNSKDVGYVIGNVAQCCWPCNRMKGALSDQAFINKCNTIIENMKNRQDGLCGKEATESHLQSHSEANRKP